MEKLLFSFLNLSILLVFMVVKLKGPLRDFVANRQKDVAGELESVRSQLQKAQADFEQVTGKLQAVGAEVAAIREHLLGEATQTKNKMIAEASRSAGAMTSDAKAASEHLFGDLKVQLYARLLGSVLAKAEGLMSERLTGDDKLRINQEFSNQVVRLQ